MGSLQRFVDHDPERHYFVLLEEGAHHDDLRRFAALDIVINNTDRKGGHVIADAQDHLWGFDHGVCFNMQWKLRTVIWDFGGEHLADDVAADLERLSTEVQTECVPELRELLSPFEVDAVCARANHLLAAGCFPTVEPGYHSYPWPLV